MVPVITLEADCRRPVLLLPGGIAPSHTGSGFPVTVGMVRMERGASVIEDRGRT